MVNNNITKIGIRNNNSPENPINVTHYKLYSRKINNTLQKLLTHHRTFFSSTISGHAHQNHEKLKFKFESS